MRAKTRKRFAALVLTAGVVPLAACDVEPPEDVPPIPGEETTTIAP